MAQLSKRHKALSVSPLKTSPTAGAALAFLGVHRSIPMLHGAQGCTAFAKVFFVRHFREPIPLQTTAMEQISAVMGADENVLEGLATLCEKSRPAVIGLLTTALSETEGTDIQRLVREFRAAYPQYAQTRVIAVNTPDYVGDFESGYALAVRAMIETLLEPRSPAAPPRPRQADQVNVLVGASLTPGDVEELKALIEAFGLYPVVLPDLSTSLDGHLESSGHTPLTTGGTPVDAFAQLDQSIATLVIGASMDQAADQLKALSGVPDYRFPSLMGLTAVDAFLQCLAEISQRPVPPSLRRQRMQLEDAMLDAHFMLGMARIAIAADADLLHAFTRLLVDMGAEVVAAVAPARAPILEQTACAQIKIGDLQDLEQLARMHQAELLIGNSHAAASAQRLGIGLLRAGFPQYDILGGHQRTWIGYRGTRQTLFDLANLILAHDHHAIAPYRSIYAPTEDRCQVD